MEDRSAVDGSDPAPRKECPRCLRPEQVCYCAHLTRIETSTRVVLLQHPREQDVPIGTARMATLCLPGSELHVGVDFRGTELMARLMADRERPPALLYPGEGAIDVGLHPPDGPITLVVVDGTWAQARKLVRTTPELAAMPRYTFVPRTPSEYRIRHEPDVSYVSTIESLVYVLGALERDPERFVALLAPFRAMVGAQLDYAARSTGPRHKRRRRRPRGPRGPTIFRERESDLVCIAGEANAWPLGSPEREDDVGELVHWLAHRLSTGETFEAVIAPKEKIAPGTPKHIEMPAEAFDAGISLDAFRVAWRAFLRESDVLCAWGNHPTRLLAKVGGAATPDPIDLRHVVRVMQNRNVGSLEAFQRTLGETAVATRPGRGGRRLAMATEVTRHLVGLSKASAAYAR